MMLSSINYRLSALAILLLILFLALYNTFRYSKFQVESLQEDDTKGHHSRGNPNCNCLNHTKSQPLPCLDATLSKKESRHMPPTIDPLYLHYVRFRPDNGNFTFRFLDYLSVMSGVQRLQPDAVYLHGDYEPIGPYWKLLKRNGLIKHLFRNATTAVGQPTDLGGVKQLGWKEHSADIAKLDVLLEYGGVAVDFDVFFIRGERIRPILQTHKAVSCYGYNIGFIAGRKNSKFLYAWRRSYEDIYVKDWNFNQATVCGYLSALYRDEVYVVNNVCNNPHPQNLHPYFHDYGKMAWNDSIAIHSYERFGNVTIDGPDDLCVLPLTSHKEVLLYIYINLTLPNVTVGYRDEIDPLTNQLI